MLFLIILFACHDRYTLDLSGVDTTESCEEIRTAVTYSDETETGCADNAPRYFIYFDADNDGYGADYATATSTKCQETDIPPQYVTNAADCNDDDVNVYPCNGC